MAEFIIKGADRPKRHIEFDLDTEDGDLNINANGTRIAYIDKESGKLYLDYMSASEIEDLPGLSFNSENELSVA